MNIVVPHGFEENYTLGFVKGLAANGVKFCVISCDGDHDRLVRAGIDCVNLRGSQSEKRSALDKVANLAGYYLALIRFLLRHKRSVVHMTGIFRNKLVLVEGLALNFCLKWFSAKYIYTAHNTLPHSRADSRFFQFVYRWVYRVPDVILVHTARAKQELVARFGVPEGKIRVISIGLNEEMPLTTLEPAAARARLGIQAAEKVILFFGKLDEYKGVDLLIPAFAKLELPGKKLLLAGSFPNPEYRARVLRAIDSSPAKDCIVLHEEYVPNEDVEIFFKTCDVLVLPYRNIYQSGLVFLSLRFGVPVVATDVGSLREFIDNETGVVAETNDVDGFAAALARFFADRSRFKREKISLKANQYRWEDICRALVPLYQ